MTLTRRVPRGTRPMAVLRATESLFHEVRLISQDPQENLRNRTSETGGRGSRTHRLVMPVLSSGEGKRTHRLVINLRTEEGKMTHRLVINLRTVIPEVKLLDLVSNSKVKTVKTVDVLLAGMPHRWDFQHI